MERDLPPLQQLNEKGMGDVQDVRRLLRGQFGMDGDDAHGVAPADLGQHVDQQTERRDRDADGMWRPVVVEDLNLLGLCPSLQAGR